MISFHTSRLVHFVLLNYLVSGGRVTIIWGGYIICVHLIPILFLGFRGGDILLAFFVDAQLVATLPVIATAAFGNYLFNFLCWGVCLILFQLFGPALFVCLFLLCWGVFVICSRRQASLVVLVPSPFSTWWGSSACFLKLFLIFGYLFV